MASVSFNTRAHPKFCMKKIHVLTTGWQHWSKNISALWATVLNYQVLDLNSLFLATQNRWTKIMKADETSLNEISYLVT